MDNTCINSTLGSCIDLDITYTDEANAPENIQDSTFDIYSASRPAFKHAVLTVKDASIGLVGFHLAAEDTAKLMAGNINWFRIRRNFPDDCAQVSEPIWVNMV